MKRISPLVLFVLAFGCVAFAQTALPERRVIEVSGSAERLITPDTFSFKLTVVERLDKKEKKTIEQQETALRSGLTGIGVDPAKALSVFDISSNYIPAKKVRDVMGRKTYMLKLTDISKIAPLIELVDQLDLGRMELDSTEHSDIVRLRRETKMDAMRAAKEKAVYLLGAIEEKVGKPVYIKEIEELARPSISGGVLSISNSNYINRTQSTSDADDNALSFEQIRLRYVIEAKFEIQ